MKVFQDKNVIFFAEINPIEEIKRLKLINSKERIANNFKRQ